MKSSNSSNSSNSSRKKEQKTAQFFREISVLIQKLSLDEPEIAKIFVTRAQLTRDCKICYVYFAAYIGSDKDAFNKSLEVLKLYKPSLRKALSQNIRRRYTPDLVFLFDETKEKERKITKILDQVYQELQEIEKKSESE